MTDIVDSAQSAEKLFFSHVWEDPTLETEIIKVVLDQDKDTLCYTSENEKKMLLVCSGGDTVIHIIGNVSLDRSNIRIDVIDNNRLQIATCVFKLLLFHYLKYHTSSKTYFCIMYGDPNTTINYVLQDIKCIYSDLPYIDYLNIWNENNNMDKLTKGLACAGELEKTFAELVATHMNFTRSFDHNTLAERFGESAVNLSSKTTFSDRFSEIYKRYIERYGFNFESNRFYHRMFLGRDRDTDVSSTLKNFKSVTVDDLKRVRFILGDLHEHVKASSAINYRYNFIQTSNVSDWLNTEENVKSFVKTVLDNVVDKGLVLWRSLNGEYDLENILENYPETFNEDSVHKPIIVNLPLTDESCFYKTVIVSRKMTIKTEEIRVKNHTYFSKIIPDNKNSFTPEKFLNTQIPFYYAVKSWVKVLTELNNKIKSSILMNTANYNIEKISECVEKMITLIQENIEDEMGKSDVPHTETFKRFLTGWNTILSDPSKIELNNEYDFSKGLVAPHVQTFVDSLYEVVNTKSIQFICGALGEIEYIYISVSKLIKEFSDFYKVSQPHYVVHEILDVKHSTELFEVGKIASMITLAHNTYENTSIDVLKGMIYGRTIFLRLYADMEDST